MSSAKRSHFDRASEAAKHQHSGPLPENRRSAAHYSKGFRTPRQRSFLLKPVIRNLPTPGSILFRA